MKKKLLLGLLISMVTLLSGCSFFEQITGTVELAIAFENMEELSSYSYTMDVELVDYDITVTSSVGVMGNYQLVNTEGELTEQFIMEDGIYTINSPFGFRMLELSTDTSSDETNFNEYGNFDFEKEEDYYVFDLTEEDIEILEGIETMKVKVENDYVKEMILIGEIEGEDVVVTCTYGNYNNMEMVIEPYATVEEVDAFLDLLAVYERHIDISIPGSFIVVTENAIADCDLFNNTCFVESSPMFMYHLEYQTVIQESLGSDNYIPYLDYIELETTNEYIDENMFDIINEYYRLLDEYGEEVYQY